ncbi:hypothetical protein EYC98_16635 [Halieaceae bacterium IMCC14734]|uniref:Lipoprotein n=1 Tax=Candidatus Litorirhabdus singularis TaxID=2518993 RepID=A0ABT3TJN1_9GAMM|nr:hypothetical protein [Candidatus Litorirhabdus singularis]MCX2982491.1 hypothetical protein [Candidatus Litorirhabdus singularis]
MNKKIRLLAFAVAATFIMGCDDNPDFMSEDTLRDRGNSDGFAVGCDERGHLTYGYDDDTYRQAYSEGYAAGQRDPDCKKWRRENN